MSDMTNKSETSDGLTHDQAVAITQDLSPTAVGAIIRENTQLSLKIEALTKKNILVWFVVALMAVAFVLCLLAMFVWYPKYRYIPTTDNTAICGIAPEDKPRVSYSAVSEFAKDAVLGSYTYDYVNYRTSINISADKWFTADGRKAFQTSLEVSGNLQRVIQGRLTLKSMATAVPQIEEEGIFGGKAYWLVRVPIVVEFYAGGQQQPISRQDYLASVTVIQTPPNALNLKGIAVDALTLAPTTSPR